MFLLMENRKEYRIGLYENPMDLPTKIGSKRKNKQNKL